MAFTQNSVPTIPKQPRAWTCAFSLSDASNWKQCVTGGANGSKVTAAVATSNDTSARVIQMALGRSLGTGVTATNATPAVFTQTGTITPLAVGDQIILGGTTAPTGFTLQTVTYFVSVTNLNNTTGTFSLSTTAANAAAGTNIASTSTGTAVTATVMRLIGSLSITTLAGTEGVTAAQNFFNSTLIPLPVDQDGQQYQFLETGDSLYFSATTTLTSAKFANVVAIAADF